MIDSIVPFISVYFSEIEYIKIEVSNIKSYSSKEALMDDLRKLGFVYEYNERQAVIYIRHYGYNEGLSAQTVREFTNLISKHIQRFEIEMLF